MNENEDTECQNLWFAAKAVLTGKLIPSNAYIEEKRNYKINYLSFQLRIQ